jgi:hypothetical protein
MSIVTDPWLPLSNQTSVLPETVARKVPSVTSAGISADATPAARTVFRMGTRYILLTPIRARAP